jgi:cAMP phosphodiesterase
LGCHGGELPSCKTTCFLVNGELALDAGALCGSLSLEQLSDVDNILITHSHFDHIKDLPLLADLMVGRRKSPVVIHASTECVKSLKKNVFNDEMWPDFTRIPTPAKPILKMRTFRPGARFTVGRYSVQTIPVTHPVESCAFVVTEGKTTIAMSGDTGPTEKLWQVLNKTKNLRAVLVETSFPNSQQKVADVSGHLTPRTLEGELGKLERNGAEVYLYHLKPAYVPTLRKELAHLPVGILELGDSFEF